MSILSVKAVVQACLLFSAVATAVESPNSKYLPLENDITTEGLISNLRSLDAIANANGGNRAFGLPGYKASVDYVVSQVSPLPNAKVWTQDFAAAFSQFKSLSLKVGEKRINISSLQFSPSTSDTGVSAPLVLGPTGTDACSAQGYEDIDAKGKIVLVTRQMCPDQTTFAGVVRAAAAAGAASVIIVNNVPYDIGGGTLGAFGQKEKDKAVPTGLISQADGQAIAAQLRSEKTLTATFQHTQINEQRVTQNVFAETTTGDQNSVIMLGAHLDSVQAGAGINDDGSGVTLLLEIFKSLSKHTTFKNKIRFAWWGAEESGLLGSNFYTRNLKSQSGAEADNILAYLNFDMIARGYFGIFDGSGAVPAYKGPPGSEVLHKLFKDAFTERGINKTVIEKFAGNSDYGSFVGTLKKPSGGLHTGSSPKEDSCYHRKCDDINNVDKEVLTTNALITAKVIAQLAAEGEKLIPRTKLAAVDNVNRYADVPAIELRGQQCGGHVLEV
ncbi:Zn-dependent exopeptidase [Tothia fuscella]|uniref:Peptide hydrolase n=1 Tax=Tothia fuscella TaxID=1048955 RepID=A0A9P4TTH1_9PEZI|nr:Zn-dependent exopeptidase [Tothia fuscella]